MVIARLFCSMVTEYKSTLKDNMEGSHRTPLKRIQSEIHDTKITEEAKICIGYCVLLLIRTASIHLLFSRD